MEVVEMKMKGLKLIKPKVYRDNRGFFFESYNKSSYEKAGIDVTFVQDNHSLSSYKTIRGMHFQELEGQDKLMSVARGCIFHVAVDMRRDSDTFGQWEGVILDDKDYHQLFVPAGFAHGFCVLSDSANVVYKVSRPYNADLEKGFIWNDKDINIKWPVDDPVISIRDAEAPSYAEVIKNCSVGIL